MAKAADVYRVIKNNGAIRYSQRPTDAQLRLYANLVERNGVRFETDAHAKDQWSGRTKWQMSKMIAALQSN